MKTIDSNGTGGAYAAVSDAIVEAMSRDTGSARGLPNEAFTAQGFLDLENRYVFSRSWVFAGPASDLPERGDVKPIEVAGRSLFMARGHDDEIRVFQNVCPHRGARLVTEAMHRTAVLTCPYHAWSYGLDGALKARPHYHGSDKHDRGNNGGGDRVCLFAVRSAVWHDWVFVNLDGKAPAFEDYMAPVIAAFACWDLSKFRLAHHDAFEFGCNWKLAVENFCDTYHVFKVHPALHEVYIPEDRSTAHPDGVHMLISNTLNGPYRLFSSTTFDDLPSLPDLAEDLAVAQHAANLFPNATMVISPGNLQFVMFEPVGAERCVMHMWFYFVGDAAAAPEHEKARQMVYGDFAAINAEDEDICQRLQQGRNCDAYDGGRLAPFWDDGTANFHRQIAAAIRGEGAFERPA